ncbi:MAG TPA: hypothetical protein VNT55_04030, partial [Baekduia sp.]|nr:hypothetical protein [Baekduia sp.]
MSFFTIDWQPPANIGLLPQHAGDGQQPFFTIGWTVKQQATWYPYNNADLVVGAGGPDDPAPPSGGGGGGDTPTPSGGGTVTGTGDTTPS